jgi:hypothetical protein
MKFRMGTQNSVLCVIDTDMTHEQLMNTVRWQQIRWFVYDRDGGMCRICGRPGMDTHHLSYKFGFFEPRAIILVGRPCHRIWQGKDPDHLSPDHSLRPKLLQIAAIARSLRGLSFGPKVRPANPTPWPECASQMLPATQEVYVAEAKKLMERLLKASSSL